MNPTSIRLPISFKHSIWISLLAAGVLGTLAITQLTPKASHDDALNNQTVKVQTQDWVRQIQANGVVQAERKINLSPEDGGKIAELYISEGDFVTQGQMIARLKNDRIEAQVNQYQALLQQAQADLDQKRSGSRPEEIAQAQARLASAQADWQQLESTKTQEIEQSQAQLEAAQARTELAQLQLNRYQQLAEDGAIAQDKFDEAKTDYTTALASQAEAQKKLEQLKNSQAPELAQRQAATEEAVQALKQLQNGTRSEEIAQAEAVVSQAQAQLAYYQSQLNDTFIRAPFAGVITRRFAQEGDLVTPTTEASINEGAISTSIAELSSGLEIEAKIPEANLAKIAVGQAVEIRTDAFPDKIFQGKVKLISPRAVQENNITTFRVKVALLTAHNQLKLGMNVRLIFQGEPLAHALVIPLAVVVTQSDGQTGVYLVDEQGARFKPIKVSEASGDQIRVLEGLEPGDRVLMAPPSDQKIEGVDTVTVD